MARCGTGCRARVSVRDDIEAGRRGDVRRDVRDVVVEDGLERIKAELTLEHLVVSRVVEDAEIAVELLRGGDELHVAACSVRSLELAPLLLVDLALVLVRVLRWR